MKLLFKQRIFSWFDSYDILNEQGECVYRVKGQLSWGHKLLIYDNLWQEIGRIEEEIFTFLPKFHMFVNDVEIGMIAKELTFLKPKFHLTCNDWQVEGNFLEWNYEVHSPTRHIMSATKELFQFSDTYVLDIEDDRDVLHALMIVLAIDAAKCSQGS